MLSVRCRAFFFRLEVVNHNGLSVLDGIRLLCIVEPKRVDFHRRSCISAIIASLISVSCHCVGPAPVIFHHHINPIGIERKNILNDFGAIFTHIGQNYLFETHPTK